MATYRLPMFPLGTNLLPQQVLPLHVFEPRYQELTRHCLEGDREFGVVLIERGPEVGGGEVRTNLGSVALIIDATPLGDGRWALVGLGTRRCRVVEWLPDDPYPLATVEDVVEAPWPTGADRPKADEARRGAERAVRRALALKSELDEPAPPFGTVVDDDPLLAAWQLAVISPLGLLDRQELLALDDPVERLMLLESMTDDLADAFADRLAAG